MPKIQEIFRVGSSQNYLINNRYKVVREIASHLRLTSDFMGYSHHITIPDHCPLKVGTLNNILKDIAEYLKIPKEQLIEELFGK